MIEIIIFGFNNIIRTFSYLFLKLINNLVFGLVLIRRISCEYM